MTALEILNAIDKTYKTAKNSDLIYELMLANFVNISGFVFQTGVIKQGSPLIRARFSSDMTSFLKLSDVSYPQKFHVTDFSRLNRPRQNLFYASESEKACIAEMLPFWLDKFKTGDRIKVTLGKWILRKDLMLLFIPDTKNVNKLSKITISQLRPEEKLFWDYFSEKLKTSTKEDKNIYEFTSAFANALWLNSKLQNIEVSGFLYSSVQSSKDLNIALTPETIENEFIVPSEFVEIVFLRNGITATGLPTYKEIGERKRGIINIDKSEIEWI